MDRLIQLLRAASISHKDSTIYLEVRRDARTAESLYRELSDLREHGWLPELTNKLPDTPPDCE